MNGLDWAILVVIGILGVAGMWKGLIRLVFAFLSVVAAVVVACLSTGIATEALTPVLRNPALAAMVGFVAVLLAVLVILGLVGRLLSKAVHVLGLGWVDRLGGAVLGMAGALLIVGSAFLVITMAGLEDHPVVRESSTAPLGLRIAAALERALPEKVRDMMDDRRKPLDGVEDLIERGRDRLKQVPDDVKERIPEDV